MTANPILRNPKSILFYLSFVIVLAVLYINLITLESKVTFTIYLVDAIVFNILIAAIGLSFWYSSVYLSIENNKIGKVILTHFGGGLLISVVWMVLGYFSVISIISDTESYGDFFITTIKSRFIIGILYYLSLIHISEPTRPY